MNTTESIKYKAVDKIYRRFFEILKGVEHQLLVFAIIVRRITNMNACNLK